MLVLVLLGSFVLQSEAVAPNLDIDVTVTTAMLFVATLSVTLVAAVFFVCERASLFDSHPSNLVSRS
jgi:hypothetical protein